MIHLTKVCILRQVNHPGNVSPEVEAEVPAATYNYITFVHTLGADLAKNRCNLSATGIVSATGMKEDTKTVGGLLQKVVSEPGDTIFMDGIIAFSAGVGTQDTLNGQAQFNGFSASPGLTNVSILSSNNLGGPAVLCGGPGTGGSGPGQCGTLCLSTPLVPLAMGVTDNGTNCQTDGGEFFLSGGNTATASMTSFVYPLAGAMCNDGATWDECCKDPNLVWIFHAHETFASTSAASGTVTDLWAAGKLEAVQIAPAPTAAPTPAAP